jgi:hypothetical protein
MCKPCHKPQTVSHHISTNARAIEDHFSLFEIFLSQNLWGVLKGGDVVNILKKLSTIGSWEFHFSQKLFFVGVPQTPTPRPLHPVLSWLISTNSHAAHKTKSSSNTTTSTRTIKRYLDVVISWTICFLSVPDDATGRGVVGGRVWVCVAVVWEDLGAVDGGATAGVAAGAAVLLLPVPAIEAVGGTELSVR